MPLKDRKFIVYSFRVLGFVLLIVGLFLSLNLGKAWIGWSRDRTLYQQVSATREDLTVVYKLNKKEYVVDTIKGNSYKSLDLNKLFNEHDHLPLYCEKKDYSSCLYLDYNYTNPFGTIVVSLLLAIVGAFFAFPNRVVNTFMTAKKVVHKTKKKVTRKKK